MPRPQGLRPIAHGLLLLLASAQASADPVQTIRANYAAVEKQIAAQHYRQQRKEGEECGDISSEYTRWTDSRGTVRKMAATYYNDSLPLGFTEQYRLWFDAAGRLDFVLFQKTENSGAYLEKQKQVIEMRAYYDNQGRILQILNKYPTDKAAINNYLQLFQKVAHVWQETAQGC